MKDDGGQAFPLAVTEHNSGSFGMTLRDYYAGKAMEIFFPAGVVLGDFNSGQEYLDACAARCGEAADAMLREREKE